MTDKPITVDKECKLSDLLDLLNIVSDEDYTVLICLGKFSYRIPKSVSVDHKQKRVYIGVHGEEDGR